MENKLRLFCARVFFVRLSDASKNAKLECTLKNVEASKNCSTICFAPREILRSRIRTAKQAMKRLEFRLAMHKKKHSP